MKPLLKDPIKNTYIQMKNHGIFQKEKCEKAESGIIISAGQLKQMTVFGDLQAEWFKLSTIQRPPCL